MWKVQLSELNYDAEEAKAVAEVLETEWLTMGSKTACFERDFANLLKYDKNGIFVSSATAGLHLILMAYGVGHGDEVIMPALTFVSDANCVVQLGAKPVFVDSIGLQNFNASIESIKENITVKTKAIIVVHFAGFPMQLNELKSICDEKNILLIEDCAHAPGASVDGQFCGTIGHSSFFSFFSNKNLAVGEGGMVFCRDDDVHQQVRLMRSHGMSTATLQRHEGRASTYDVLHAGLNYRPDEIRAALGITQLKKLSEGNRIRKDLFDAYRDNFNGTRIKVAFESYEQNLRPSYHIMPTILPEGTDREVVMKHMRDAGIQTSIHYPSFRDFTAYNSSAFTRTPVADEISRRELTLPLHPRMENKHVGLVAETLLEAI